MARVSGTPVFTGAGQDSRGYFRFIPPKAYLGSGAGGTGTFAVWSGTQIPNEPCFIALRLIGVPGQKAGELDWLYKLEPTVVERRRPDGANPAKQAVDRLLGTAGR